MIVMLPPRPSAAWAMMLLWLSTTSCGSIVMLPPLPVSRLTEAVILLLRRYTRSLTLSVIFPPLAVVASVEIAAPSLINSRTAETVIEPASPLPADCAVICGPGSGSTMSEATITVTSPPCQARRCAGICAPPRRSDCCLTVTGPPRRIAPRLQSGDLSVATPAPSSNSAPVVVTSTDPPAPVPSVVLAIFRLMRA